MENPYQSPQEAALPQRTTDVPPPASCGYQLLVIIFGIIAGVMMIILLALIVALIVEFVSQPSYARAGSLILPRGIDVMSMIEQELAATQNAPQQIFDCQSSHVVFGFRKDACEAGSLLFIGQSTE